MIYEQFLAQFTDWRPKTLYWQRFSIAESYGKDEVKRVYDKILKESKKDYTLITELVMILNHKSWEHSKYAASSAFCELYTDLYRETNQYALDNLTGKELTYFLDVTD